MLYLCFDYGEKRIGAAVGDELTGTARVLPTLAGGDWLTLQKMLAEWRPQALVVGLPLNDDGSEQPASQRARKFALELQNRCGLPVHFCDERYSSRAADDVLREARANGDLKRRVRKGDRDAQSARVILQQWLSDPQCRSSLGKSGA